MSRQATITSILDNIATLKRGMYACVQHSASERLSRSQTELLGTIEHLQPVGTNQLAKHLYLTPGAVSQLAENLVQSKLLERHLDEQDRRKQYFRLTAKGSKTLRTIRENRLRIYTALMEVMSDDELEQWEALQRRVIEGLATLTKK